MDTYKPEPGNTAYLTCGYLRECNVNNKTIASSLINMVQCYYSKFNGKSYRWKIKDKQTIQQLLQKSNFQRFDSDAFDIGLPNKCFLQITKEYPQSDNAGNWNNNNNNNPNTTVWGGWNNNNNNTNNNNMNNNNNNNNNNDMEEKKNTDDMEIPIVVKLLSLPLSIKYDYILCHYELYNIETRSEWNGIWRLNSNNTNNTRNRKYYDSWSGGGAFYGSSNYLETNWGQKTMYLSELMELEKSDKLNELTFECRLNILKIVDIFQYNTSCDGEPFYCYNSINNKNEFRFEWSINDKFIIDEIINCDYKTFIKSKPFHSDILCDMFQFKIQGIKDEYIDLSIGLRGLPLLTNKMIIKLELYCLETSNQQIMSNILTLDLENNSTHSITRNEGKILMDIIKKYKQITLICKAYIIEKYDYKNNIIIDDDKEKDDEETEEEIENIENDGISQDMDKNIISIPTDSFIWNIFDNKLLKEIKKKIKNDVNNLNKTSYDINPLYSSIYNIHGFKWYLSLYPNINWNIFNCYLNIVNVPCFIRNISCKIKMELLEINDFKQFIANYAGSGSKCVSAKFDITEQFKKLNKITLKVTISMINIDRINNLNYNLNSGIIDNIKSKLIVNKSNKISLLSADNNSDHDNNINFGSCIYKITDFESMNKIKNARNGSFFNSSFFMMHQLKWYLNIAPNGRSFDEENKFILSLIITSIPPNINNICLSINMIINEYKNKKI